MIERPLESLLIRAGALQWRPPSEERVIRISSREPPVSRASCQTAYSVPRPSTANDGTCGDVRTTGPTGCAAGAPVANRRAAVQWRPPSLELDTRYQAGSAGV